MTSSKVRAIFFDVGSTLIDPEPSVGHIYAQAALKHGLSVKAETLEGRFKTVWKTRQGLRTLTPGSRDNQKYWWEVFVKEMMFPVEGAQSWRSFDAFFDELYKTFEEARAWRVFPDVRKTLALLKDEGFKLGVISNWDWRLRPLLNNLNLDHFFDTIVVSGEIGIAKPDRRIFQEAVGRTGEAASECLHVGNDPEEDVEAAEAAGLSGLLINRKGETQTNRPTIGSLNELPETIYNLFTVSKGGLNH